MLLDVYKKAFQSNSETIYWGGDSWTPIWDSATLYLYVCLIFIIWLFSSIINSKKNRLRNPNYRHPLLKISFVLLFIFMAFRGERVGIDTISYMISFSGADTIKDAFAGNTEPLYNLFLYCLRTVFSHHQVPIIIFSLLIIYFVYSTIKRFYFDLNIVLSLTVFVALYYFQSFNLMRITIAASFLLWSFPLLLDRNYKAFAVRIIIASLFHYSSIVLFLPLVLLAFYNKNRKMTILIPIAMIFSIGLLANFLQEHISVFNRYSSYIEFNQSSDRIGMSLFVDYLPCIFILCYLIARNVRGVWSDLMVVFTLSAFVIRLLAYYIIIAGRLHTHFMVLTVIILPYWVSYIGRNDKKVSRILYPLCFIWILIRLHLYLKSYLLIDGIMPYYFCW